MNGTKPPKPGNIISFARGIGRPPVEALVAADYLTKDEAAAVIEVAAEPLSEWSDDELLAEIAFRLRQRPPRPKVDDITDRLAAPDDDGEGIENDL
jgi:hypothetical protein